ncbi:VOC family protein [Sphingomonas immobilis]|uniref:VOC family protein n=1 Tax=Sphingomonas immobilis TaxID=3063997 RepID=A0ABT9A0A2_9SPHN|nr:VOC family protein [Sphingomonas sp. CA1-15]MDO7843249.1 VOC family protein [Sphingomonas sp. CA1-15]
MFSHMMVGADDLDTAKTFYDATLGAIGMRPGARISPTRVFYTDGAVNFLVTTPIDGEPATHANGGTIGFSMKSPDEVEAWHAAGVAAGGKSCEDPPGVRGAGTDRPMYLAYLRDPAGNKLCALHFLPAGS